MKIKRIVCINNIMGLSGAPRTVSSENYKIEYTKEFEGFIINDTVIIPISKINEIIIEQTSKKQEK